MKICDQCGCVNDSVNRYCRNCGACFEKEKEIKKDPGGETSKETESAKKVNGGSPLPAWLVGEQESLPDENNGKNAAFSPAQPEELPQPNTDLSLPTEPDAQKDMTATAEDEAIESFSQDITSAGPAAGGAFQGLASKEPAYAPVSLTDESAQPAETGSLSGQGQGQAEKPFIDFDFMEGEPAPAPVAVPAATAGAEKIYSTHPVIHALKKCGASGWTLAFCLFFTGYILLTFLSNLWYADDQLKALSNFLSTGQDQAVSKTFYAVLLAALCVRLLLSGLTGAGMWSFYACCANRKRNYVKTGGLSLVSAVAVVDLFLTGIGFLLMVGVCIYVSAFLGALTSSYPGWLTAVIVMGLVAYVLFTALALLYYAKVIRTNGRIRKTSRTGNADSKISVYIVVIHFALVLVCATGIGYALANAAYLEMALQACRLLSYICISVSLLKYRDEMKNIEYRQKHPLKKTF